ncbi:hypothetical protein EDD16DRAFT_1523281 [Pisolithus croceorrhizus]|nr:hypothetical protein EDD16DRAFT_1523281 [Pisolithus croceorrhizus]
MSIPAGFGSALVGVLISTMFLSPIKVIWYSNSPGVSYAYMYYMHYSEDAWAIRFLVTAVWILSTLHFSFMCHFLYYYLIINYGVPMSFLYVVWFVYLSVSKLHPVDEILQVIASINSDASSSCTKYITVKWWVTAPMMLSVLAGTGVGVGTPALVIYMLSEILIAVSLCTLLYDNDSRSTFPRLITIAELATDIRQLESWTMALDFICQGSSLNTRQYLRAQTSYTVSDLRIRTVNFAKLSKLEGHVESSEDGSRRSGKFEDAVIDITADPALRKEAEV